MVKLDCVKCGYSWSPKVKGNMPKECPECKSRNWKKEEVMVDLFENEE